MGFFWGRKMSGLRFVLGSFQETEISPGPVGEKIENALSNLSSQTAEPVVDIPAQEPAEATIPYWVWFLLIPVVLPLFLLLFRGKGTHPPANVARRLDLRSQPEGAVYRERKAPDFAKHNTQQPGDDSETTSESPTEPSLDSSRDSSMDSFDDEVGFDSAHTHHVTPQPATETSPSPVSHTASTNVAVQDHSVPLSTEIVELRRELAAVAARLEESRVNDKLPHLEQELEMSHERFRQTELQRKALAKQLDESDQRNQRLTSEIALLQTEVEALESRLGEATEAGQKLEIARQELESLTQKFVALEQVQQQTEQARAKLNDEIQLERSARNELGKRCDTLESKVADTSVADAMAARLKTFESENQAVQRRLGQVQEAHDSLVRQLADAQARLEQQKSESVSSTDSKSSMLELKLAEKRKLLAQVQAKLREKLEVIEKLKRQSADSGSV